MVQFQTGCLASLFTGGAKYELDRSNIPPPQYDHNHTPIKKANMRNAKSSYVKLKPLPPPWAPSCWNETRRPMQHSTRIPASRLRIGEETIPLCKGIPRNFEHVDNRAGRSWFLPNPHPPTRRSSPCDGRTVPKQTRN